MVSTRGEGPVLDGQLDAVVISPLIPFPARLQLRAGSLANLPSTPPHRTCANNLCARGDVR